MVLMTVEYVGVTTILVQVAQIAMRLIIAKNVPYMMEAVHLFYIQEMLIEMVLLTQMI